MKNTDSTFKIAAGLFAGAIIGGALGILLAPEKGETTRKAICDKSGDITDSIQKKMNDLIDCVKHDMRELTDKAKVLAGRNNM